MAKNINCNLFTYLLMASAFLIQYTVVLLWLLAKDCKWLVVFNPFFKKVSHDCFINDSAMGSSCQTAPLTKFAHNSIKY
jgi:hypothetical protein